MKDIIKSRRHIFYLEGVTDLEKQRAEALLVSQGDSRAKPQIVVIHHHKYGECKEELKHEVFYPPEEVKSNGDAGSAQV